MSFYLFFNIFLDMSTIIKCVKIKKLNDKIYAEKLSSKICEIMKVDDKIYK